MPFKGSPAALARPAPAPRRAARCAPATRRWWWTTGRTRCRSWTGRCPCTGPGRCPRPRSPATPARAAAAPTGWCSATPTPAPRPACWTTTSTRRPRSAPGCIGGGVLDEPVPAGAGVVARYGHLRGVMSQEQTFDFGDRWGYPKTANVACRRAAFEQVGGFTEQIRAAEDADLTYRLRAAGWEVERREHASVVHSSRTTLRGLVRAAGAVGRRRRLGGQALPGLGAAGQPGQPAALGPVHHPRRVRPGGARAQPRRGDHGRSCARSRRWPGSSAAGSCPTSGRRDDPARVPAHAQPRQRAGAGDGARAPGRQLPLRRPRARGGGRRVHRRQPRDPAPMARRRPLSRRVPADRAGATAAWSRP